MDIFFGDGHGSRYPNERDTVPLSRYDAFIAVNGAFRLTLGHWSRRTGARDGVPTPSRADIEVWSRWCVGDGHGESPSLGKRVDPPLCLAAQNSLCVSSALVTERRLFDQPGDAVPLLLRGG